MTSKNLNHYMCPKCCHDFYSYETVITCDACGTTFRASDSRTCRIALLRKTPSPIGDRSKEDDAS
jgi:hypothetical protein